MPTLSLPCAAGRYFLQPLQDRDILRCLLSQASSHILHVQVHVATLLSMHEPADGVTGGVSEACGMKAGLQIPQLLEEAGTGCRNDATLLLDRS